MNFASAVCLKMRISWYGVKSRMSGRPSWFASATSRPSGSVRASSIGMRIFSTKVAARPEGQHADGLVAVLGGDVEDFALAVGEEVGDAHAGRLADDRQRPREGQAALRVEAHQAQHRLVGAEDEHRRGAVHFEHGDVRHALQAREGGLPVPLAGPVLAEELDLGGVGVGDDDVHPFRIGQRAEGERVRALRAAPAQRVALERPVEERGGIRRLGADLVDHQPALRPLDGGQFGGAVPVQVAEGHAAHRAAPCRGLRGRGGRRRSGSGSRTAPSRRCRNRAGPAGRRR